MHWLSPLFYILFGSEMWTLKRIRNDWQQSRWSISEEQPATPFLTTKGTQKFWKDWKENQLTRN